MAQQKPYDWAAAEKKAQGEGTTQSSTYDWNAAEKKAQQPFNLTPQSVFGPVGQWLQTNVQPKMEQFAQEIKRASRDDMPGPPSLGEITGDVASGSVNALAHPVQNAEVLAPLALELGRAFNPVSRGLTAVSMLRGVPAAGPIARSAVAVGQGVERSALAGGMGAGVSAADAGQPVLPAAGWGALRQGAGDLAFGGGAALIGAISRGTGRMLGLKAGNLSDADLANLWLAERPASVPASAWIDQFNPKRAKTLVKDTMTERAPGSIFGDEYFESLRKEAVGQRGARRDMLDSTRDVDPSGDTRDLGQYAVNLSDIPDAAYGLGQQLGGKTGGLAPGASRASANNAGDRFLAGRTGVGIEDQTAIQRLVAQLESAKQSPPVPTGILDAQGQPILKLNTDELDRIGKQLADARTTATDNFNERWVDGTAPSNPEAIPVGLSDGSAILRNIDKELLTEQKKHMTAIGGKGEYVPTPEVAAGQAMRDALNQAVNAKAPKVRWNGQDYDYDDFRKLFSRTITWRDTARKAVGSTDGSARVRGGVTMSGRPFANVGESTDTIGGALARPLIGFGESTLKMAPKTTSLARLAYLLASNQPQVTPTMSGVNTRGLGGR